MSFFSKLANVLTGGVSGGISSIAKGNAKGALGSLATGGVLGGGGGSQGPEMPTPAPGGPSAVPRPPMMGGGGMAGGMPPGLMERMRQMRGMGMGQPNPMGQPQPAPDAPPDESGSPMMQQIGRARQAFDMKRRLGGGME